MPDTKRQKIVSKILAAVQGISIANDFETDIGENVDDWRTDWQEDELPGTSVCDQTAEAIENLADEHLDFFSLPVQIRTTLKTDTRASDARKIEADLLKSLEQFKDGIFEGNAKLAIQVQVKRSGFVLAEDAFSVVAIAVEIEVIFHTKRFDAYQ
jgi:hypothetical protein